jgi:hypothetical protein
VMATDLEVRRLLCAINPTWYERALGRVVTVAYKLAPSEKGPIDWIGDRADDLRVWSWHRRAGRA